MDRSAFNECVKTSSNNKSPGPGGELNEIIRMLFPNIQESIHKTLHYYVGHLPHPGILED
eukprot:1151010-Pelagomonas_calceolata.AAC.6